jgi:hypothetical protein
MGRPASSPSSALLANASIAQPARGPLAPNEPHDLRRVFKLLDCLAQLDARAFRVVPVCQRGALMPNEQLRGAVAWLASHAWPRLMPCFDGEASEVLMHPLGTVFNVGDDHANHLSSGHALWAA